MASVNKIILLGYLGKNPEMVSTQSGTNVTKYSLATTEKWGKEDKTEWHNVVCFGRLAEISNEYLRKGSLVYLEGKVQSRSWEDKNGNKKYITEVIAYSMQMLGGGNNSNKNEKKEQVPDDNSFLNNEFGTMPTGDDVPF